MRYTILFVVALILVSGFIAYFGDLLGRRMGKKRLTLFGLRPRHTAIIATTITGMLISALVLFVLISVNSQFRKILTTGEQILVQNRRLSTANADLERMNETLLKRSGELTRQVTRHQREVDAALEEVRKAKQARDKAEAAVVRLEREIAARKKELAQLRNRTEAAESELVAVNEQLNKVRAELSTARSELTQARQDLSEAQDNLFDSVVVHSDARDRLAATQEQLEQTEQQLTQKNAELEALEKFTAEFAVESAVVRKVGFILNQGDEIVRGKISSRQSKSGLEKELYSLLERASERAAGLGGKIEEQNNRAVTVVYRVYSPEGKYALLIDDEPELVSKAVETIRGTLRDVLVQVVCAVNTLPGEQVPVELKLYINKLVFHQEDKIAQTKIDGRLSEGRILLLFTDFWKNEVSRSAIESGIIPAPRPDQRSTVGQNPQEHVDELFRVLDRIKATDAEASVAVYAASDICAADLLDIRNVRFSVTRSE